MLADRFGYKQILSLSAEQFIGEIHNERRMSKAHA